MLHLFGILFLFFKIMFIEAWNFLLTDSLTSTSWYHVIESLLRIYRSFRVDYIPPLPHTYILICLLIPLPVLGPVQDTPEDLSVKKLTSMSSSSSSSSPSTLRAKQSPHSSIHAEETRSSGSPGIKISIYLSISLFSIYLTKYLFIFLSPIVLICIYFFISMSIYLSIYPSMYSWNYLSMYSCHVSRLSREQ